MRVKQDEDRKIILLVRHRMDARANWYDPNIAGRRGVGAILWRRI